ncbi:MAG: hypothetical protein Q8P22_07285, partial [Chloroflexota bacterium]|nr:hypothetical protein [Chloroflexota bacterium]
RLPIALAGLLLIALAACGQEEEATSTATPTTPASPTLSPTPFAIASPSGEPAVCAADSTQRFQDIQQSASFKVFCPTFLPEGFTLDDIQFGEVAGAVGPPDGPGALRAVFKRDDPEGKVEFIQGRPGLSAISEPQTSGQKLLGEASYDGFQGSLFERAILARSPDGFTHKIAVERVSTEELQQIAAAMSPVSP